MILYFLFIFAVIIALILRFSLRSWQTALASFGGAVVLAAIMEVWLWYLQAHSLFGLGKSGDDIDRWWTEHLVPLISFLLGGTIGLIVFHSAMVQRDQSRGIATVSLIFGIAFIGIAVFLAILHNTDFIFFWWPVLLCFALIFLNGIRLLFIPNSG